MKLRLFLLVITTIISYNLISAAIAPPTIKLRYVTQEEALRITQQQFSGQDVDIFLKERGEFDNFTFFVDPEPMKGWMHDAYVVTIPNTVQEGYDIECETAIIHNIPNGNFQPISIKNRYGDKVSSKPTVKTSNLPNASTSVAQRTFAVIISGGINKVSNHERYWNDCSFIYQTLSKNYGVPKSQIYPLMSDGTDPATDTFSPLGYFFSQSLDLDFDGNAEIKHAATRANVISTFNTLSSMLKEDDHLFVFVIDHGGTDDFNNSSYICLWNNERIYDYELANLLRPITGKFVNVNVVLGQCFSGGFMDNLEQVGCVTATACKGSESSYALWGFPYDEFVYQWTCAVNGADHQGNSINADTNRDGFISMDEAFAYAKQKDRIEDETPQYQSYPLSVGEDLAFNRIAPAVDLYIKDNPEDTGKQPNLTTDKFWCSPSIWVRNQDDGIEKHENPYYAPDHLYAMVYVKVHNRGKKKFNGGQWVHVYWAQASTGFTDAAWKGRELYNHQEVTGEHLRAENIPPINPGGTATVGVSWGLPKKLLGNSDDNNTEKHHFCLLAKIMDTHIDDGYDPTKHYFNVKGSNKQAQKNVSIIKREDLTKATKVFVRNVSSIPQKYTLEFIPRTSEDAELYDNASIQMSMSQTIYEGWENGGLQAENMQIPLDLFNEPGHRNVYFISRKSRLKDISLAPNEFDAVSLTFNFNKVVMSGKNFIFDLVQKDENGNIVGGETFEIERPNLVFRPDVIDDTSYGINTIHYDSPSKNSLIVSFENEVQTEGALAVTSILNGKEIIQQPVSAGTNKALIDISQLPTGIYNITYISNGTPVDNQRFYK